MLKININQIMVNQNKTFRYRNVYQSESEISRYRFITPLVNNQN